MAKAKRLGLQIIMARSYAIDTKKAACVGKRYTATSAVVRCSQADVIKRRRQSKVRFTDV
ncbi:hypothetical protein [Bradyrhizobium sp.]|uniref:hypothetical protein n=1 Tax=Bradyrhizobium sp. TaxID=376 RepID=UPI0025C1AF28|nr:hypothetical protein [Bradyrhizobium sp.]